MRKCKNCGVKYTPKHVKQEDCGEGCLIDRFSKLARKTRKIARIYAGTQGYRSIGEVRFQALAKANGVPLAYEIKTVNYQHQPQKYTADFTHTKKKIHLEYKGKLDVVTRKKLLSVKRCNPTMDIRLVFEKPNNFIRKKKTPTEKVSRYWEWAEKNGFKWYAWGDIKKIKSDLK